MKKGTIDNIEIVRGYAALVVFVCHIFFWPSFNGEFGIANYIPFGPPGHLMVMVFFLLSGYVIGYTTQKSNDNSIFGYIKKRIVRIYPIYLFAIAINIMFFKENINDIVGTLFFVHNLFTNNLVHNSPLWSLNHEFLYYMLAIPVIFFKVNYKIVIGILFLLLSYSLFLGPFDAIFEGYLVGFIFWLLGYGLSKIQSEWQPKPNKILSALILLLACEYFNIIGTILLKFNLLHGPGTPIQNHVKITDFGLLPVCLYVIILATGILKNYAKWLALSIYSIVFAHIFYLVYQGNFLSSNSSYIPTIFVILSVATYFWDNLKVNFNFLIWLGSISYALYAIHMPILLSFQHVKFFTGNLFTFFVRIAIIIPLVIWISFLLEKKMQPYIKKLLDTKS